MSTGLMAFCGMHNITLTFLDAMGGFYGRVCGPVSGNVLLRKRQYDSLSNHAFDAMTVRYILLGKVRNSKDVLIGLIPYTQAMLFARVLRRDLDMYPPFVWR